MLIEGNPKRFVQWYQDYQKFSKLVNERPIACLRDLLTLAPDAEAISIDEVEHADNLYPRFDTAAMSIGALHLSPHSAHAIAMNDIV